MRKHILYTLVLLTTITFSSFAQIIHPVKWSATGKRISKDEGEVIFSAKIEKGWHTFSQNIKDGGPVATTITLDKSKDYVGIGKAIEQKAKSEFSKEFNMMIYFFENNTTFRQKVKISSKGAISIKGGLEFQCCNESSCIAPETFDFNVKIEEYKGKDTVSTIKVIPAITDTSKKVGTINNTATPTLKKEETNKAATGGLTKDLENKSLWALFFIALGSGFIALLTPCIYPMIPMTVCYFMNNSGNKRKAISQAILYGISIIVIYVLIGTVVSVTLGEGFTNWISTHWIPNVAFFLIFLVFAASFFGMFELTLPSWIVNSSDKQADKGGIFAPFFMAFTLVVVSFSCTAPFVGAILTFSMQGEVIRPIIGMLGFSLAFAVPFTAFAIFPRALNSLPKSGGWLNSVKVVLGFIELALGLKFLSVADQTYHWGILDREIYLAIWIVIAILMGMYLLGKLKFAHDSEVKHISVPRLLMAIAAFTFAVYMIPGMFGAPLKALAGWTPPMETHSFDLPGLLRESTGATTNAPSTIDLCEKPKYDNILKLPHGMKGYFDLNQALKCSKETGKPVFIDFTGHACVNCRAMEQNVWSNPQVLKRLKEDYIVVALYVDDKTELPKEEWYTSKYDGKLKKSIGEKNFDFQKSQYNLNQQPGYVLVDSEGKNLLAPRNYNLDINEYIKFLDEGKAEFKKRTEKK